MVTSSNRSQVRTSANQNACVIQLIIEMRRDLCFFSTDLFINSNRHPSTSSESYTQSVHEQSRSRRPRRPWTRAVFSNLQRKGLEKRFQVQKYLTKADRHQLASMLGLSDNQVKVWFQNRRMKWRQEARESVTSTNNDTHDLEEEETQQSLRQL